MPASVHLEQRPHSDEPSVSPVPRSQSLVRRVPSRVTRTTCRSEVNRLFV